ncbi:hypothetical protein [Conexibacter sp. DBS9H8]|uniref:hypothetical protein n=1 Tax=Conexibacter sp. DBS9H8 TaxID=2937801 RepID=UPI00200FBC8B|nr:hypothetical protein [Conexibacter sp. DBS9H8]
MRSAVRRIIAVILALLALTGLAAGFAPAALADGDPASDVLVFDPVFNPPDSGASPQQAAQLAATTQAITRAGLPIRVALIASAADLGTVTELWKQPAQYAYYLGRELSLQFHGAVLVVMPQGYGLYVPATTPSAADQKALGGLNAPGGDLAGGAQYVLGRLAADNGLHVNVGAVRVHAAAGGSGSPLPLIGLLVGAVILAGVWTASLRARPLRARVAA